MHVKILNNDPVKMLYLGKPKPANAKFLYKQNQRDEEEEGFEVNLIYE